MLTQYQGCLPIPPSPSQRLVRSTEWVESLLLNFWSLPFFWQLRLIFLTTNSKFYYKSYQQVPFIHWVVNDWDKNLPFMPIYESLWAYLDQLEEQYVHIADILNILESKLCPSQIKLVRIWQCKGIEWYHQAGISWHKQILTFYQLQMSWQYVGGKRVLSSGHWVTVRQSISLDNSVSVDDKRLKAVLEASWILLASKIHFVYLTLFTEWTCYVCILFFSSE